jgi:hypothetical protein
VLYVIGSNDSIFFKNFNYNLFSIKKNGIFFILLNAELIRINKYIFTNCNNKQYILLIFQQLLSQV